MNPGSPPMALAASNNGSASFLELSIVMMEVMNSIAASLGVSTSMVGKVWGSGVYTDDSSICAAALHAGVVSAGGGSVNYTILSGQESYQGSIRNGVSMISYGKWKGSFRFK